jgi:hypothetical protein
LAEANIQAELAAVAGAEPAELDERYMSWGEVRSGSWQAIGDSGAVHCGPATDTLRVILVLVLTVENHQDWTPMQYSGPGSHLALTDPTGLVRWKVLCEVASRFIQNRSNDDGREYEEFFIGLGKLRTSWQATRVRSRDDVETPEAPDFLPWLQKLLAGEHANYTVHEWPETYVAAFLKFVAQHAAIFRGDTPMAEDCVENFVAEDTRTRRHCARIDLREDEWNDFTHSWQPVFTGQECQAGGARQACACGECAAPVIEGYMADASGVTCDRSADELSFMWQTDVQLPPDVKAEVFHVPIGSEDGFTLHPNGGTPLVIGPGQSGVIFEGFNGPIKWRRNATVLKDYEYLSAYGEPHGNKHVCGTCGLGCGGEHYRSPETGGRDVSKLNVTQLKGVCTELGLKFRQRLKRDDLLRLIQQDNEAKGGQGLLIQAAHFDLCRVCYLKNGPAKAKAGGCERHRHGEPLTRLDEESQRVQAFLAAAQAQRALHLGEMNAARNASGISSSGAQEVRTDSDR